MKNKRCLNDILSTDRKALYIVLGIVMISVLTLTVVYAALSTTLSINGNAEVTAASWDIYLDNVVLNSNSTTTEVPTITDYKTATFSTTLSKPGDFYEFTIDVVNNGSIDAMIDSVTKTPELSVEQKKYLNYIVEYKNGETINTKQLVPKKSFVRLLVKVEFRKDITASDLPTTSETLNLSFKVNYVQSDESGTKVPNNGKDVLSIVSGDLKTVGSEIAIGDEHFYVISNTDGKVTMLAKYNLYVGKECTSASHTSCTPYEEATGIQDSTMKGDGTTPRRGTIAFSSANYWYSGGLKTEYGTEYPAYVYDNNNSLLYNYIENYKSYLESQGVEIEEARLIKIQELISLGCRKLVWSCSDAPEWVYETTYWTGEAYVGADIFVVFSDSEINTNAYDIDYNVGLRPVIVLKY